MAYDYPSVADFKAYFQRDFPYGTDPATSVLDIDITKAMSEANFNFNSSFYATQENFNIGFLYLTAHYLVTDLRASSQGISGQFTWLESSKSVGSVSQSFSIPQRIMDDPNFAWLMKTNYGAKYLMLLLPQMVGNMFSVCGRTHA